MRAEGFSDATLEASEKVFAVVAAASLAGLNPWVEQKGVPPVVSELWTRLRLLPAETVVPLRDFVVQHRRGSLREDLARYVSLALVLSEPPDFEFLFAARDLPPDVKEISGFRDLVKKFYAEANLRALWLRYLPAYEGEIARLRPALSPALLLTRAYLRLVSETSLGRRYLVYLDWLVPPGLTNARNYGDNYYLVINPAQTDLLPGVRHQYFHFLVDPFTLKYATDINEWGVLHDIARRAPRLPEAYREDFLLLTTECLIQAIELRLDRLPDAQLPARLEELERNGYIFVRHFLQGLRRFEEVEPSLRFYFPEFLARLDVAAEQARLQQMRFAAAEASAAEPEPLVTATPEPLLAEAERQVAQGKQETARALFERVLNEYNPEEPRALYGLAVIASLQRDAERARDYFERTLRVARDPHIQAWSHIYLGRIHDLAGNREQALAHYRAALAVNGVPEKVQQAARQGLEAPYRPLLRDVQP